MYACIQKIFTLRNGSTVLGIKDKLMILFLLFSLVEFLRLETKWGIQNSFVEEKYFG